MEENQEKKLINEEETKDNPNQEQNIEVKNEETHIEEQENNLKDLSKKIRDYAVQNLGAQAEEYISVSKDGFLQIAAGYSDLFTEANSEIGKQLELFINEYKSLFSDFVNSLAEEEERIQAIEALEEELSLTKALEREIDLLNRKINSTAKVKDRAFGSQRIKLIEQEIGLQNQMIQKQNELSEAYKAETQNLMNQINSFGAGVSFGTNGLLNVGSAPGGLTADGAGELLDFVQKYDEALNGVWDAQEASMEASMEAYDLRLEQLQYSIEMTVLSNQQNIETLERLLDKLTDKMFSAAEKMNNLILQAINYGQQAVAYDADNLLSAFGLNGSATSVDSWVKLFQQNPYADRNATYEQLQASYEAIAQLEVSIYDLAKNVADTLVESFEEMGDAFGKIESKIDVFNSIIDNYNTIIGLSREFTDVDSEIVQRLIDSKVELSKTSLNSTKSEYEALLASQKEMQQKYNQSLIKDSAMASYWKQQLDSIGEMVDNARAEYMSSWQTAIQQVADAFKASMQEIVDAFEKSVTGSYGTFAEMQKQYDQQAKMADVYLEPYERMYELTKLTRNLEKEIDESNNVKYRKELMELQDEINKLQKAQVKLSKDDLTFLQKKYELRLAEIALEEAQKAKNTVTLQRNAEGGWGYVYTADKNEVSEAEQKYEDAFYAVYSQGMKAIESNESKLLSSIQKYLSEIKSNEGDQAKLNELQNTFGQEIINYSEEIDKAISNLNEEVERAGLDGYEAIQFSETLLGEILKDYTSANEFQESFLSSLATQVLAPAADSIKEYEQSIKEFLNMGADGSLENSIKKFENELSKENENLNDKIDELTDSESLAQAINVAFSDGMQTVFGYYDKVQVDLEKIVAAVEAFMTANDLIPMQVIQYWEPTSPTEVDIPTSEEIWINKETGKELSKKEMDKLVTEETGEDLNYLEEINGVITEGTGNAYISERGWYESAEGIYEKVNRVTDEYGNKSSINAAKKYSNGDYIDTPGSYWERTEGTGHIGSYYTLQAIKNDTLEGIQDNDNWLSLLQERLGSSLTIQNMADILKDRLNTYLSDTMVLVNDGSAGNGKSTYMIHPESLNQAYSLFERLLAAAEYGKGKDYWLTDDKLLEFWQTGSNDDDKVLKYNPFSGEFYYLNKNGSHNYLTYASGQDMDYLGRKRMTLFGFDTGGYTGSWGTEGRLAMLHQKELILNAEDTENFLSALGILRSIVETIDLQATEKAFNNSSIKAWPIPETTSLEQQVTIHAEFPNAINHTEIEEAFNNIINTASQYANRK